MKSARRIVVTGRVQGVGYRPFVYVTARELGLTGSVLNGSGKVFIQAEGTDEALDRLESALIESAPPLARPRLSESTAAECSGATEFRILASSDTGDAEIHVPPDLFTCDDCVAELTTAGERRFGYPFINCTQCGPRYTIITAMPYDRPNTSMAGFPLCDDCRREYESPLDRRFHAQPLACAKCGPELEFVGGRHAGDDGINRPHGGLQQTIGALEEGAIVAVKGVGGYHLVCDAANEDAIGRLRQRKHRPHKPLAVMFPLAGADGLDSVREHLLLDDLTTRTLLDPARPIVLVEKRTDFGLGRNLAPGLKELGAFLPYSPLHHQLLQAFGRPIVATSGNISGEPVITDENEAGQRLAQVTDAFLHHNRPIVRPADDPVLRPVAGRARAIRLGRGTAPLERNLPAGMERPTLAVGGHLKVTIALAWDDRVVVSPHVGELDSRRSFEVFHQNIKDIQNLYDVKAEQIVCDLHPRYASTRWAAAQKLPVTAVQHHAAHASALAGEHPDVERWLVFTWDGVGYGSDGTLWGGEALAGGPGRWIRRASFRPFRLAGGDLAGRQPWRSAAALLWSAGGRFRPSLACAAPVASLHNGRHAGDSHLDAIAPGARNPDLDPNTLQLAHSAWQKNINTHTTTAVGRLFDAAAALVLGRHVASFEGQGPMELEQVAGNPIDPVALPLTADESGILRSDWAPLLPLLQDSGVSPEDRAARFHATMARALVDQAIAVGKTCPFDAVGLSGGVFQNRLLTEMVLEGLAERGIEARLHEDIPANDGGLSYGQIIESLNLGEAARVVTTA
jgi:hydrogenase maturation protein HypF